MIPLDECLGSPDKFYEEGRAELKAAQNLQDTDSRYALPLQRSADARCVHERHGDMDKL